jgi:hypothetical protein
MGMTQLEATEAGLTGNTTQLSRGEGGNRKKKTWLKRASGNMVYKEHTVAKANDSAIKTMFQR